jgi:hypothetical protein
MYFPAIENHILAAKIQYVRFAVCYVFCKSDSTLESPHKEK